MPMTIPESEASMLPAVLQLFPENEYRRHEQVPLGRKRIDLVCLRRQSDFITTVELKISDWQRALWQATVNCQVSNASFIAMWHRFRHRAEQQAELLCQYGVGLISVTESAAEIVLPAPHSVRRIPRDRKLKWYQSLLSQEG